jgi:hypothetical protein
LIDDVLMMAEPSPRWPSAAWVVQKNECTFVANVRSHCSEEISSGASTGFW